MNPLPQHSSEQLKPICSLTLESQLKVFVFTLLSQRHWKQAVHLEVGLDFVGTVVRSLYRKGKNHLESFWKGALFQILSQNIFHHQDSPKQCLCCCCYYCCCCHLIAFASQANDGGGSGYCHNSTLFTLKSQGGKNWRKQESKGSFKTKSPRKITREVSRAKNQVLSLSNK